MDRYNQFEIGQKLARNFLSDLTTDSKKTEEKDLPYFSIPIGYQSRLFPDYFYLEMKFPY